jgi:hypothetical protein
MKKNSLWGCLQRGQKNIIYIYVSLLLTIDAWNLVGSWVIRIGESESGYNFGVKGQKNIAEFKRLTTTIRILRVRVSLSYHDPDFDPATDLIRWL